MTERLPKPEFARGGVLARIQEEGRFRVGVCPDTAGFAAVDPNTGRFSGLDITFARKVAQAIFGGTIFGVSQAIDFVPIPMTKREFMLQEREVDAVISSYAITPERRKRVAFTDAYYGSSIAPIAHRESGISHFDDFAGASVVVVEGTTGAAFVHENDLGSKIWEVESVAELVDMVRDGTATTGISAACILDEYAKADNENLALLPFALESVAFGVGLPNSDIEMREFLNLRVNDLVSTGFIAMAEACRTKKLLL